MPGRGLPSKLLATLGRRVVGQTHYRVEWFLRASGPIVAGVAIAEAGVHLFKQYAVGDCEAAARMIPIIDYGPYFAGAPGALEGVAADVAHACENVGFFYALNHGVSDDTIERAFAASRRFHALPLEQKLALRLDDNNIGYLPIDASIQGASAAHKATRPNQNESFFVAHDRGPDHPDVIAGKPLRGRNRWRRGCPACVPT
jgi:hypothetical protein